MKTFKQFLSENETHVSFNESFDHREAATKGVIHPDHAKTMKAGEHVDFYHRKTGDKHYGKVLSNDNIHVRVQDKAGKTHKFKVAKTYEGHK